MTNFVIAVEKPLKSAVSLRVCIEGGIPNGFLYLRRLPAHIFRVPQAAFRNAVCGKESVTRRLSVEGGTAIRAYPAARPSTEAEIAQYEAVQAEIAEGEAAANKAGNRIGLIPKLNTLFKPIDNVIP